MRNKKIITNLFSLTSIQLLNYLLPLITMPYLVSTIGMAGYGLLSFAQATMQYFILLTDYGFNIIGTQKIALAKEDVKKRNQIFSEILVTKLLLLLGSFFLLLMMMLLIPKLRVHPGLYLWMFGIVIGNVLFPIWFFQGMEEMKHIGILNFLGKLIFTLGIFTFVKGPKDLYLAGFLNALGYMVVGIYSLILLYQKYFVRFQKVTFQEVKTSLKEGFHLFVANISTSFYTTTNIFFLGIVVGNTATGVFNLANTLIRACASLAVPITQTFFPRIALKKQESKKEALQLIKRIFIVLTVIFTIGCLILLFASKPILTLLFKDQFKDAIPLIQIMSFLPLMVAWGNVFGILVMSLFGYQKQLSRIYFIGGLISLLGMVILTYQFHEVGTAWNAFLTEGVITSMMMIFLWHEKKNLRRGELDGRS